MICEPKTGFGTRQKVKASGSHDTGKHFKKSSVRNLICKMDEGDEENKRPLLPN
jgi:hypothetical protein